MERIIVKKGKKWKKLSSLDVQEHHILSNKHGKWTGRYQKILDKYELSVNGDFNKIDLHQAGPHPETYHREVFRRLTEIDELAKGDKNKFKELFKEHIYKYVEKNPEIIHHNYIILGE